ncbi:hypothetical protein [Streptomyces sp. NPDC093105]|uniref:hypothetical protein n=1 Tax=Streptomyces sp. NPDC093105 TaxID=3366029 RepID=UPI00380E53A6
MTAATTRRMTDVSGAGARTLPGWAHGPHDTLPRITPQTVTGHRLGAARTA